ncbi:MAG: VWA domain-containing protein, partial [Thermoanaerobaculia bacterium]
MKTGGALVAIGALVVPATFGQDTFSDATSVVIVEVPVRVQVGGVPLRGLTAEDFELRDEGERRTITGFEVVDFGFEHLGADFTEPAPVPIRKATRNYLFFIDLAWGGGDPISARRRLEESIGSLRGVVARKVSASDRVAIGYFSAVRGVKLLLGFTDERQEIYRAIDALDLVVRSKPRQLERDFRDWKELPPPRRGARAKTARGPIRPSLEDLVAEARQSSFRGDINLPHSSLVMYMTRGLRLISRNTRLVGEKHLVLLSAGPLYGGEGARSQRFIQELFRDFRQQNWAIEAINTAGLGFGRDSLRYLADGTGGQLYANTWDIESLLDDMFDKTSVSYILVFQLYDPPAVGTYRKLKVELKDAPEKTEIVHRPGYYVGRARSRIPGVDPR